MSDWNAALEEQSLRVDQGDVVAALAEATDILRVLRAKSRDGVAISRREWDALKLDIHRFDGIVRTHRVQKCEHGVPAGGECRRCNGASSTWNQVAAAAVFQAG